uniref:Uncharacterized protein n=1 Tax=Strongyloides papillosus TaxID=174720 RepID=A0A0N5BKY9_STREA
MVENSAKDTVKNLSEIQLVIQSSCRLSLSPAQWPTSKRSLRSEYSNGRRSKDCSQFGRIATPDEKQNLIKTQKAELKDLLRLCNIPSTRKVLLPIIWDTKEIDPIEKELDNTVLRHLEKDKSSNLSKEVLMSISTKTLLS